MSRGRNAKTTKIPIAAVVLGVFLLFIGLAIWAWGPAGGFLSIVLLIVVAIALLIFFVVILLPAIMGVKMMQSMIGGK